ncbi:MAG: hypothetical protein GY847_30170 [Proteobacteria bacterium]|nr:hypothetical protein [Pseudomonadota bacterium]
MSRFFFITPVKVAIVGMTLIALGVSSTKALEPTTRTVEITVVDTTIGYGFIVPGEKEGLRPGRMVTIDNQSYRVLEVSALSALIETTGQPPKIGAAGSVSVAPTDKKRLQTPKGLTYFTDKWPEPVLPASVQKVKPVPTGGPVRDERLDMAFTLNGSGLYNLNDADDHSEYGQLRMRIHYEPISDLLSFDADLAAQTWLGAYDDATSDSRPPVRVSQLQASSAFGKQRNFRAALGRLRYASNNLGMLDGTRLQVPLVAGFSIGAFGGFVPDPLNGMPTISVSRFGGDVAWQPLENSWNPMTSVSAHGSIYDGNLDERRVQGSMDLFPEFGHFGANFEVAFFDEDNPWNAAVAEVSNAGTSASVRMGIFEVGGRFHMQRPERSLLLNSYFPTEWLCVPEPSEDDDTSQNCMGDDIDWLYQADVAMWLDSATVDVRLFGSQNKAAKSDQLGGMLHWRLLNLFGLVRLDTSVIGSISSFYHTVALPVAIGMPFLKDRLDLSVHYIPSINRYEADIEWFTDHSVGAALFALLGSGFDLSLFTDFVTGRDLDMIYVQIALTWRPEL